MEFALTRDIYSPSAIAEAIEQYKTHLQVVNSRSNETETVVCARSLNGTEPMEIVVREFLNYLLDLSVRAHLAAG